MKTLCAVAGASAEHVALCDLMAQKLQSAYDVAQVRVISNGSLLENDLAELPDLVADRLAVVGYLGRGSVEKGMLEAFGVFRRLSERSGATFEVVGPIDGGACADEGISVKAALGERMKLHGGLYGSDKFSATSQWGLAVMPSRYANEAEPRVVLELLAQGVPVIATGRGCLSSLAEQTPALMIVDEVDFVEQAVDVATRLLGDAAQLEALQRAAVEFARSNQMISAEGLRALVADVGAASGQVPREVPIQ